MKGSKSPFQAPEPRAGAWSHQGGPRGSRTGSLDGRGTGACCGLTAGCQAGSLDGRRTWAQCGLAAGRQAKSLDGRGTWACYGLEAITNKPFYGGAGGQGLPDCFPCSPGLVRLRGS